MMKKAVKYGVVLIVAVIIYSNLALTVPYAFNIHTATANTRLSEAEANLSSTSPFGYNLFLNHSRTYNVSITGFGKVGMTLFFFYLQTSFPPVFNLSTTKLSSPAPMLPPAYAYAVFQYNGTSSFSKLKFSVSSMSINNSNGYISSSDGPFSIVPQNDVLGNSGGSYYLLEPLHLQVDFLTGASVPGTYYLKISMEFYDVVMGLPLPVKNVNFCLPFYTITE